MTTTKVQPIRTTLLCVLGASWLYLLSMSSVLAAEFQLVTLGEYTESLNAGENPVPEFIAKAVPDSPVIKVLSPSDTSGSIESPVDIELSFESAEDASIDMSSVRIYYLMFIRKDITERILEHATVGDHSIRAKGAKLPSGKHTFLIEVRDSQQRVGSQKFVVKVSA